MQVLLMALQHKKR